MRIAVIGHVEHITLAAVAALPVEGDIVHLDAPRVFPGGGGGVAFFQLLRSPAEILLFTALGDDDAARTMDAALAATGARIHAARRAEPHTRDLVLVTPDGERTIFVVGQPLQPLASEPLPWHELATCDGVYFTGRDPDTLRAARAARMLVVTARRRDVLARAGVAADVVVGSVRDPREVSTLADYPIPPRALVLTDGERGGHVETAAGVAHFPAVRAPVVRGNYGAGDSFAAALAFYLTAGEPPLAAATRAAAYGAAVLAGLVPLDHQLALTLP